MASKKVTALTADTNPASDGLIPVVKDPSGTPLSRKVTLGNAFQKAHGLADGFMKIVSGVVIGAVSITKSDVGLANVDNTSDVNKPVSTATSTALGLKEDTANKAVAGGYASLDGSGKIPSSQLPAIAITSVTVVASQAAQLALTAQEGDIAVRSDLNKSYIHNGGVAGTMADWTELATPTDLVISVNGYTGAVTLTKADVGLGSVTNDAQLKAADLDTDGTLAANSASKVPSQSAVKTYADTKQAALGFTPENVANKDTNTSLGTSNTAYPSQNAVKVYADTKMPKSGDTFTGAVEGATAALTDAATIATDASLANAFRVTLGGNRTLGNPTNPTNGQRCIWEIIQDGTGSRTLALDTKFAFGTDIPSITLSTTANKRDFLGAVYNSTTDLWYVVAFVKGY